MKKFSETAFGIIVLSVLPSVITYLGLFNNISMEAIHTHFATHIDAYIALLVWFVVVIVLLILRINARRKERTILLIQYIEKLREETNLQIKNAELNESDWRKSLVESMNEALAAVSDREDGLVAEMSIEKIGSEQLNFFKQDKVKTLEREINELRDKLLNEI